MSGISDMNEISRQLIPPDFLYIIEDTDTCAPVARLRSVSGPARQPARSGSRPNLVGQRQMKTEATTEPSWHVRPGAILSISCSSYTMGPSAVFGINYRACPRLPFSSSGRPFISSCDCPSLVHWHIVHSHIEDHGMAASPPQLSFSIN